MPLKNLWICVAGCTSQRWYWYSWSSQDQCSCRLDCFKGYSWLDDFNPQDKVRPYLFNNLLIMNCLSPMIIYCCFSVFMIVFMRSAVVTIGVLCVTNSEHWESACVNVIIKVYRTSPAISQLSQPCRQRQHSRIPLLQSLKKLQPLKWLLLKISKCPLRFPTPSNSEVYWILQYTSHHNMHAIQYYCGFYCP